MTGLRRRFATGVALVALLAASEAVAERPTNIDTSRSDTTSFAYALSRGQVITQPWSYHARVEALDGTAGGVTIADLTMTVRHEVQSVDGDGIASVSTSLSGPTGAIVSDAYGDVDMDAATTVFEAARMSTSLDAHGNVSDRRDQMGYIPDGPDLSSDVPDMLRMLWFNYPTEPVAIGDSWLGTIPMSAHEPEEGFSSTIVARYTLAGFASVGDAEVAVLDIDYTFEAEGSIETAPNSGTMLQILTRGNGDGYALVTPSTGRIHEFGARMGSVYTVTFPTGRRAIIASSTDLAYGAAAASEDEAVAGAE